VPVTSLEDIFQLVFDAARKAFRTVPVAWGARKHAEQPAVATVYASATNKIALTTARRFIRMYATQDMYWVDSATSDANATTKLTTAGSRGFLPKDKVYDLALADGITRLDFLAVTLVGAVYVTAMD
jgi:hypothetical protein